MKKIKILIIVTLIVGGLIEIIVLRYGFPLKPLIYWWIFAFTVFLIWNFKFGSGFMLWIAFLIFILSGLLVSAGLISTGETLMRVSFLGWIIGLIQSMVEYKRT